MRADTHLLPNGQDVSKRDIPAFSVLFEGGVFLLTTSSCLDTSSCHILSSLNDDTYFLPDKNNICTQNTNQHHIFNNLLQPGYLLAFRYRLGTIYPTSRLRRLFDSRKLGSPYYRGITGRAGWTGRHLHEIPETRTISSSSSTPLNRIEFKQNNKNQPLLSENPRLTEHPYINLRITYENAFQLRYRRASQSVHTSTETVPAPFTSLSLFGISQAGVGNKNF